MKKMKSKMFISDFFRIIRTNTELNKEIEFPKTILITSVKPGEGKSFICSNLALSYTQTNKKVLIIDADMKSGIQAKSLKVDNATGLSELLMQTGDYEVKEYIKHTNIENLDLLPQGEIIANPIDIMTKTKIEALIKKTENLYDIIIFDGISSLIINEMLILSSVVDSTIIVTAYGKTKLEDLQRTKRNIENVNGKISGVIINEMPKYCKEYKEVERYMLNEYGKLKNNIILKQKAKKILTQNQRNIENMEKNII